VKIETVYPGWYAGRALHIHVNVFIPKTINANGTYATDAVKLHTGQIFFNVSPSLLSLTPGNFDSGYGKL
jgi:protocatechuate 3,4-dioxygenase beta subunit